MMNTGGVALAGPGGRFDLTDPQTAEMVRHISSNPDAAPQYGVTLAEAFALQNMLNRLQAAPSQKPQTTVIEDLQAKLAQATQAPREAGIASLPSSNFQPENFAGGGIVAFDEGGATTEEVLKQLNADRNAIQPTYGDKGLRAVAPAVVSAARASSPGLTSETMTQDVLDRFRKQLAGIPELTEEQEATRQQRLRERFGISGEIGAKREEQLRAQGEGVAEDKRQAALMALAKAGFGWAAAAAKPGAGRAPLGALAEGALGGVAEYNETAKEIRKLEAERQKELANIETLRRQERLGFAKDVTSEVDKRQQRVDKLNTEINKGEVDLATIKAANERNAATNTSHERISEADRASRERIAGMTDKMHREMLSKPGEMERIADRLRMMPPGPERTELETAFRDAANIMSGRTLGPEKLALDRAAKVEKAIKDRVGFLPMQIQNEKDPTRKAALQAQYDKIVGEENARFGAETPAAGAPFSKDAIDAELKRRAGG